MEEEFLLPVSSLLHSAAIQRDGLRLRGEEKRVFRESEVEASPLARATATIGDEKRDWPYRLRLLLTVPSGYTVKN